MKRGTIWVTVFLTFLVLLCTAGASFLAGFYTSALASQGKLPISLPFVTPQPPAATEAGPSCEEFGLYREVWDIIRQEYYGEIPDDQTILYGAIRGSLQTLGDEYTSFIEPKIARILAEDASGEFEGIGAYVRMREDGKLEISGIIPGTPAEAAGLKAGDRVLAVDGQSIVGYSLYEAIALIRGPAGTQVTLLIERPGEEETFEVTVTRARIEIPQVEAKMLDENIAYIRLYEFSANATRQMRNALDDLLRQKPRGLVLDLRNNPGGWLDQAIEVADLFLDKGVVMIERTAEGERVFQTRSGQIAESIPLVVLVNGGSASASEIVAGAIQDRGRGVLIGERTLGKGSVQRPYRLSDGSELRVTIARWYTPNDREIHGEGLKPDIEIPWPEDTPEGQDPQLERAIQYLLTGR
ncbi:MAG: S41 family peptidase [Anaerolineae bacterium]|nr:S41 family peptidase [Anaerolineae bacterium]MCX8067974.1 S41 family peptidase [Anaerolineae bacterium]MDW7991994.1 S41 family peptidase [Anaerolineae bacterium]